MPTSERLNVKPGNCERDLVPMQPTRTAGSDDGSARSLRAGTCRVRGVLAFSAALLASVALAGAGTPKRPNIVFIMCDDLGWADVGFHGSSIPTPNIDRLAKAGVELTRYYVSPVCTPTRAGLMSGRYWSRFGILGVQAIRSLPVDTVTLPRALKSAGYDTALMGKWHLGSKPEWGPQHYGFDHSYGSLGGGVGPYDHFYKFGPYQHTWHRNGELITEKGHVTALTGDEVVNWIAGRKDRDRPFFLYVPFTAPHLPIKEPQEWLDKLPADFAITMRAGAVPGGPPSRFSGTMARQYAACVMHADHQVGRIVAALEAAGKRDNTLIVVTSDNGGSTLNENANQPYPPDNYPEGRIPSSNLPLRGRKEDLYEGGVRVPCIVNWPRVLEPGSTDALASVVDWMPTFSGLAGFKPDKDLKWDGVDLWPRLTGRSQPQKSRLVYCGVREGQVLWEGDWKLISRYGKDGQTAGVELFNLEDDPYETTNLAPKMPDRVRAMQLRLAEVSRRDNDAVVPDREAMLREGRQLDAGPAARPKP